MVDLAGWIVALLEIFLFALFIRVVIDYVQMLKPGWRPRGILLPLLEIIYTVTDKPLSLIRRIVPPLRIGPVALDLSFLVLYFGIRYLLIPIIIRFLG